MKKLLRLTKTLLVAAGLLAGGNAWATEGDVIYSNDFSTVDQTDFASWMATGKVPSDYTYPQLGRGGSFSIESGALVHTSTTAGRNNGTAANADFGIFKEDITTATASKNYVIEFDLTLAITGHIACNEIFEISDEDKQTVICLYAKHTRANSASGTTTWGYIVGGNNGFAVKDAASTTKANAEGTLGDGTQHNLTDAISGTTGSKTYHVILDAQTTGVAKLTIKEGETKVVDEAVVNISASKGIKYMYLSGHYSGGSATSITLDNLSITEGAAAVSATANYTIKYVAIIEGVETEIKTQDTRIGIVGSEITVESTDKEVIWYNDAKYVYSSDDSEGQTVAENGSSVVKVLFVEPTSYSYSVINNLGDEIASGTAYVGDNVYYNVPYYVFKAGKFYTSPSVSSGSLSYGQGKISEIAANTDVTVNYIEEENTNVVFYSEAENLSGANVVNDGYTQSRMSNAQAGYYSAQTAFANLPAGVYTITAATRVGTTRFYAGVVGEGDEVASVTSGGSVVTTTSPAFILPTATNIYSSTGNENNSYFDYIIIRKTADLPANQSVTVTDAGYATLVSNYNLDFSEATIKAYKVSVAEKGKAVLEEVSKVPAKTPVVLVKDGGATENIPVTTEAIDAVTGNDLVAGTGAEVATVDGGYTNMILNKYGDKACFMFANDQTVAADKAYLHIASSLAPDAEADARMTVVFFDEVTGISSVKAEKVADGQWFNLAGQRVMQPKKGLYIVNGKKVSVK